MDALNFDAAKKSGLRQRGELDAIFGVTYPMVNRYLQGKAEPRGKRREYIVKALTALDNLIDRGSLPFSEDKDRDFRKNAVAKIVAFLNQPPL